MGMERFSTGLNYLGQGGNIPFIHGLCNCLLRATILALNSYRITWKKDLTHKDPDILKHLICQLLTKRTWEK